MKKMMITIAVTAAATTLFALPPKQLMGGKKQKFPTQQFQMSILTSTTRHLIDQE